MRRYWTPSVRSAQPDVRRPAAAAANVGDLTGREILIAGAVAYRCEGARTSRTGGPDRVTS